MMAQSRQDAGGARHYTACSTRWLSRSKPSAPKHETLEHFELAHVALRDGVAFSLRQPSEHRRFVLLQTPGKPLEFRDLTFSRLSQPAVEVGALSSMHEPKKLLDQRIERLGHGARLAQRLQFGLLVFQQGFNRANEEPHRLLR